MNVLSLDEIDKARLKVVENARELVQDAEILLSKRRFPRAYSLAHLAIEEMAKIPMLFRAGTEIMVGIEVDWKTLNRRLHSHEDKIKNISIFGLFIEEISDEFGLEIDNPIKYMEDDLRDLNRQKNFGLYTSLVNEGFRKPSEIITAEMASTHLDLANQYLGFFELIELDDRSNLEKLNQSPKKKELFRRINEELRKFFGKA